MARQSTILILMLALCGAAMAQVNPYQVKSSKISAINFFATNYGLFGIDVNNYSSGGGFSVPMPGGDARAYLFGSGVWFGAMKNVRDTMRPLVFITYNPNTARSWAAAGDAQWPKLRPYLYTSLDYNLNNGLSTDTTYEARGSGNWPLWVAETGDFGPLNPGIFEPDTMERKDGIRYRQPAFMRGVQEQFVARFHDHDLYHYEISSIAAESGYPIGLQFQQNIYAWQPNGASWQPYEHIVMLQYDIINTSSDTLFNCVVGQASDPDVGRITDNNKAKDDHVAFYHNYPDLRTGLAWSEMDGDQSFGALAMILVEGPVTNYNGFVDNSRRSDYMLQGRVGTFPSWTIAEDPRTHVERYDFMTTGQLAQDMGSGDQRALLATTSFNMLPGDTAHFAIAFAVLDVLPSAASSGDAANDLSKSTVAVAGLPFENLARALMNDYYKNDGFFATNLLVSVPYTSETQHTLNTYPNPANNIAAVRFDVAKPSPVRLRLVNSLGQTVMTQTLGYHQTGMYEERMDVTNLPSGMYIVSIESGTRVQTTRLMVTR